MGPPDLWRARRWAVEGKVVGLLVGLVAMLGLAVLMSTASSNATRSLATAFPDLAFWLASPGDGRLRRAMCEALHPGLKRAPVPVPVTLNATSAEPHDDVSIPVYILSHNNPTHVHAMVRFLRCYSVRDITLHDTASSLPLHLDLLRALEHNAAATVRRMPANAGPRSFFEPANLHALPRMFALTDADLRPHPDLPPNFLQYLAFLTRAFPGRKAGFALDLALSDQFLPGVHDPATGATIAEWERDHFWGARLSLPPGSSMAPPDPLYDASIDTTFAVYDKATYAPGAGDGVRVAGTFTATHVPWLCFASAVYVTRDEWEHTAGASNIWSSTGKLARQQQQQQVDGRGGCGLVQQQHE